MDIHHGLGRSCTDDTGKGPSREGDHIFSSACGYYDGICLIMPYLLANLHDYLFILVKADDYGIQYYLYSCFIRFV